MTGDLKLVTGNLKPFTEAKSYLADTKFYIDSDVSCEILPTKDHTLGDPKSKKDENV